LHRALLFVPHAKLNNLMRLRLSRSLIGPFGHFKETSLYSAYSRVIATRASTI